MTAADILTRLHGVTKAGTGWSARCPAHDDRNTHLSVTEGHDGRTVVHCHKGCTFDQIAAKLGLKQADFFAMPRDGKPGRRIAAEYGYTDESGKLLFQCVRFDPKDFRQRRPDPAGKDGWSWNLQGVRLALYRLPALVAAVKTGETIYIPEGERDCENLAKIGLTATCNPMGAGKWRDAFSAFLAGATVVIIPDRDEPGRKHAAQVAASLHGKASSVKVIKLPDRDGHPVKDASDFLAAGGTTADLQVIVDAAPEWTPTAAAPTAAPDGDGTALQAALFRVTQTKGLSAGERHAVMATAVLAALHARGQFYFDERYRDFQTCLYFDTVTRLLLPIRSDRFQAWLSAFVGINRVERAFDYIAAAVETEALTGNTTGLIPESYWAARPGALYLSCGDGQAVKVTAGDVRTVDNGTDDVLFAQGDTLMPWALTAPADPFTTCRVFSDMRATAPYGLDLLRLWFTSLPTGQRCKPPLVLSGTVGSGKTRAAVALFELLGIVPRVIKLQENGEGDFWVALDAGGMVCFDNADTKLKWLPDALAGAATDGGTERRRLYTDSQRVSWRARAWAIVTTSNPTFAADAGLADRLLVVRMDRRDRDTAEAALSAEVALHRDAGLSWLAHTLATALADTAPTPADLNRRHPDFATWAVRIGRAIGREAEAIAALQGAEADKSRFNLENDELGAGLLALTDTQGDFAGTAEELLTALRVVDPTFTADFWTSRKIGKRLARLWPHLESYLKARVDAGHQSRQTYRFSRHAGGYGEFQGPIPVKSLGRENIGTFSETAQETRHSRHLTPPDQTELDYEKAERKAIEEEARP